MSFVDPPYNVEIEGNVSGRGDKSHREFVMASGEMSAEEFITFLARSMQQVAEYSVDGSIHFWCMDWRHMDEISAAAKTAKLDLKNLVVWNKTNAGLGSFYRSQHELVFVYKKGSAQHVNNFGLGEKGRYRTNVRLYPGANTMKKGRDEELEMHPTVKPVAMVADAIKDVSGRGDLVLDAFGGSGTTLIAAEKTRRKARLVELDERYCDVICRRFIAFSGKQPRLAETGLTFQEMCLQRSG